MRIGFWVGEQFSRTSTRNAGGLLRSAIIWTLGHNLSVILIPQPSHLSFCPFTSLTLPMRSPLVVKADFRLCRSVRWSSASGSSPTGHHHRVISPDWPSSPEARKAKDVHRESAKLDYNMSNTTSTSPIGGVVYAFGRDRYQRIYEPSH
jgi:hypothetical protein